MAGAKDQGGRSEVGPQAGGPRAQSWSIPAIRVIKDDQGRLRIDQSDPATYGAYAARQFLATAAAEPKFKDGMTKRPSAAIQIIYVDAEGVTRKVPIREIVCRVDGDALLLSQFEDETGATVRDLPIAEPESADSDDDDDENRLHDLFMAELDDESSSDEPSEPEPEPEPAPPVRERRLPSGPLRQYNEATETAAASPQKPSAAPEPAARAPIPVTPAPAKVAKPAPSGPPGLTVRALEATEATALRTLIENKATQSRWASGLLIQAAERYPSDRKQQNEHLANLLRVSLDQARAESRTPLGAALRSVIEEVLVFKPAVLDRDPLKAEKLALRSFAKVALEPTPIDDSVVKTVSGTAQKTPAQVLAKLEDPKLARAIRVKLLMEVVPELIESWRPDKESGRSNAENENSPAIVRKMFSVADEQRRQRKYIDNGVAFKKAGERYAVLEGKLPKLPPPGD